MDLGGVVFWAEVKRDEDPHLAEKNKYSSRVFPKVETLRTHTETSQKHRKTTKGDFEGNIWTTNQRHFQNVGLGMCVFIVFGTFIKADGFESLTENDATVCAKLFRPILDLCYGVERRF